MSTADLLALIRTDTRLRRIAATCGGEYAGPCPRCGGRDRLRVQPHAEPKPRWMCRQCHERWSDAPGYLMWRDGLRYPEALTQLSMDVEAKRTPPIPHPPEDVDVPSEHWQDTVVRFAIQCRKALWSGVYPRPAAWLKARGLSGETVLAADIGYNAVDRYIDRSLFGLPLGPKRCTVWIPRGITFPWTSDGQIWRLSIRRPAGEPKYVNVAGGANALYNADSLQPDRPAVLVEGVFDALVVQQAMGGELGVVAAGTTGARCMRWISKLALASEVVVAFDNDVSGNQHAVYWCDVLHPRARRWKPYLKDAGCMAEAEMSIRAWVEAALCSSV